MTWAILAELIVKYGLPLAESIWKKWSTGTIPAAADWEELRQLASVSFTSQMQAALVRAGIALDSPEAKALLALS